MLQLFFIIAYFVNSQLFSKEVVAKDITESNVVDSATQPSPSTFQVRVLLAEQEPDLQLHISTEDGFEVSHFYDSTIKEIFDAKTLTLELKKNLITVNNKRIACDKIIIKPRQGTLRYNNNDYQGSFILIRSGDKLYLINYVDLEDYVFSVLRWESWPGWPLEVNKVFAITCRTYVLSKVLEARNKQKKSTKPLLYDIKATNIHQTYKGTHTFNNAQQAIEETRSIIMVYEGKPITAMYDSCCGGLIPAHMQGINFKGSPYLARPYACTYCKKCKLYDWHLTYTKDEFESVVKSHGFDISDIATLQVTKDKAGIVQHIVCKSRKKSCIISGKKMYSMFKNVKSFCFDIVKKAGTILFKTGRGFGHHLGLCQWGAREMVRQGKECKEILRFYYPKIQFAKVEVTDHARV